MQFNSIWPPLWVSLVLLVAESNCSFATNSKLIDEKLQDPGLVKDAIESDQALDETLLKWMKGGSASEKDQISRMIDGQDKYDFNFETHLSTDETLRRLGYNCEKYNSTSEDGYVTQLIRIINPLVDGDGVDKYYYPSQDKPVVVFYAGQGVSLNLFLMGSLGADQSKPMVQGKHIGERNYFKEPVSNRSLALTLANTGYDVWLIPARGVDKCNRACAPETKDKALNVDGQQLQENTNNHANERQERYSDQESDRRTNYKHDATKGSSSRFQRRSLINLKAHTMEQSQVNQCQSDYWSFSSDDIIKFEFRNQLDLVLQASEEHCDFARLHLDSHIALGPAVFINKFNLLLGASGLLSGLSPPGWPFVEDHVDLVVRGMMNNLCKSKLLRYTVCKFLIDSFYGRSSQFQTFLELSLLDFINRPSSPKGIRQTLQASYSGFLRMYDHGPLLNLLNYGRIEPPEYKLSKITLDHTLIVAGSVDAIVDSTSVERLRQQLGKRPDNCLNVAGYNHLDLIAGRDVEHQINEKVLDFLNDRNIELGYFKNDDNPEDGYNQPAYQDHDRRPGQGQGRPSNADPENNPDNTDPEDGGPNVELEEDPARRRYRTKLTNERRGIGEAPIGGVVSVPSTDDQTRPPPSTTTTATTASKTITTTPATKLRPRASRPPRIVSGGQAKDLSVPDRPAGVKITRKSQPTFVPTTESATQGSPTYVPTTEAYLSKQTRTWKPRSISDANEEIDAPK